jgi:hypothetical protein
MPQAKTGGEQGRPMCEDLFGESEEGSEVGGH